MRDKELEKLVRQVKGQVEQKRLHKNETYKDPTLLGKDLDSDNNGAVQEFKELAKREF